MDLRVSTKTTIRRDLEDLFSFDNDFSGANGIEYTLTEARNKGFNSNAAYFADKFYKKHCKVLDLQVMVKEMYKKFMELEGNYWNVNLETLQYNKDLIVAINALPKNQGD